MRLLALFLLVSLPCQAKPWKKIGKVMFYGAAIVASEEATRQGHGCRVRNGVEACPEKYGAFWGFEGIRAGLTGVSILLSEKARRDGFKEWPLYAGGTAAFNSWWALHESRIHAKDLK